MSKNKYMERFVGYLHRTFKNKLLAMLILVAGVICTMIDNDATFLVFGLMFGLPLFFAKNNLMY